MDEEAITARLRENVPREDEPVQAPIQAPPTGEPSGVTGGIALDDMMQYKLHEYFGQQYRTTDEESKQRTSYIYQTVAQLIGTSDYSFVVAQVRQLEQMLGTANSPDRLYRLYQWLKLDNARRKISMEMDAVTA